MIRTLDPATETMSQKTLGRRLLDRHEELETRIIKILADVPWVATTADCWAAHHNSYLGMTVHWIDPVTREQKQATLACQRLTGPHTFDVLARAISDIHCKFGVQDKVRRTTTDNAANFVKAFCHFGDTAQGGGEFIAARFLVVMINEIIRKLFFIIIQDFFKL